MKTWIFFIAGILILVCAAAGCTQPTEEEAEAQLCQDLETLGVALQNMQDLNATSSVGDIRDARDEVASAMEAVRNSASELGGVRVDELNAAYDNLDRTVQSLPDDASVVEAIQTVRPEMQAVRDARRNLTAELNCTQQ
ncbi:hypothetical protein ABH15_09495 [Methanoculleus taiwanensis]|uniref:Uncharacterized protein n=1 Tax=Methanoculleus taiwanensis TaxID=1550565 RepID=A0A498H1U6_9EURY|nr:hypothetical protein [Methanoculleus taiwanensis]RXE56335.1 hypothetical protein ABH15_09495 [Methanoculleus taiwanensis]